MASGCPCGRGMKNSCWAAVCSCLKLLDMLEDSPESFSPNVLLRPIIQDTLLATSAYVAGPAEVAYFAQASVVYQQLQVRMPVIIPRASFTLLDAHAVRLLRKYGLEFSTLERTSKLARKDGARPFAASAHAAV